MIREVGLEPLTAMASSDDFETLTRELRALPALPRRRLVELLRGFASADGRADPREEAFIAGVARALEVTTTPTASR